MTPPIDNPEDPRVSAISRQRIIQRDIDQLLGICEFVLQDGTIEDDEARAIYTWLNNHSTCLDTWPASVVYDRLHAMLVDGKLDDDEQRELLDLVMQISRPPTNKGAAVPTKLPLNAPPPPLVFLDRTFCFTGVFDFGTRNECQAAITARGGIPAGSVTKKLDYLVIGNIGSDAWKHTSFGTKIQKAVDYRGAGSPLAIISEQHWVAALS